MRRSRALAILLICPLIGLGALAIGLKLWIDATASRRWEEMRTQLAELAREARARDVGRPVLRGTPTPGNGWDDYEPALLRFKQISWDVVGNFLSRNPNADRSKIDAWIAQNASALDALRRGVTRSSAGRRIDWESSPSIFSQGLTALARCQARILVAEGRDREAAELLLDVSQYAGDTARNGAVLEATIAGGILQGALEDLKDLMLSGRLAQEDLREVARELEILDRALPGEGDAAVNNAMMFGFGLLRARTVKRYLEQLDKKDQAISARRFGFSDQIMMVDAFETDLRLARRLNASVDKPWAEARKVMDQVNVDRSTTPNPLLRKIYQSFGYSFPTQGSVPRSSARERRTQLRLLRMAAHFRISGELLELEDPFGGKLRSTRKERGVTLWSVGPDGIDDGAVGGWKPDGRDIVIDVDR